LTHTFEGNPFTRGHEIVSRKTRDLVVADCKDFVILGFAVLIQCQPARVWRTDGQTDRRTDGQTLRRWLKRAKHSAIARKKRLAKQYDNHSTANISPITHTVIRALEESINSNQLCHIQMRQRNENAGIAEKGNGEIATDQSGRLSLVSVSAAAVTLLWYRSLAATAAASTHVLHSHLLVVCWRCLAALHLQYVVTHLYMYDRQVRSSDSVSRLTYFVLRINYLTFYCLVTGISVY